MNRALALEWEIREDAQSVNVTQQKTRAVKRHVTVRHKQLFIENNIIIIPSGFRQ